MSQPAIRDGDAITETRFGFPGQIPKAQTAKDQTRLLKFFAEYIKLQDARKAARAAGYSERWAKENSYGWLKRHADYVKWLQAHAAQQVVKQIVIEQDAVLQEMARIGMVNEADYLVMSGSRMRRKRLDELTREQMVAIRVYRDRGGKLTYELRDKEGKLTELAKHVGLLNEKIILERRNVHLHKYDFSGVPIEILERLEAQHEAELAKYGSGATRSRLLEHDPK